MSAEITGDELSRWAELASAATPGPWELVECFDEDGRPDHWVKFTVGDSTLMDRLADAEFIAAARDAFPRLLALVAAQAEQNANKERTERHWSEVLIRLAKAEAELAALRATDEYQRWARAVVERDAAREAVARVRAYAEQLRGTVGGWDSEVGTAILAALDGGAAT